MSQKSFDNGITLENLPRGLLVRQFDHAYVARRWQLTPAVVQLVETAIDSGLNWMIRSDHPRQNSRWPNQRGTVYLAFSPSNEQQWSVAIDTFSETRGDYSFGVFNGKYQEQFRSARIPFTFEGRNRNSGHLVVKRSNVLPTIRQLSTFDHNVLDLGRSTRVYEGFATEYDIQRALLKGWGETVFGGSHRLIQDEFPVDGGLTSRRIDILAQNPQNGDWLVIELKRAEAKVDAVRQVEDYLLSLGRRDDFAAEQLKGALVAERIPTNVRTVARNAGISAYEIDWPLSLRRVA